VYSLRIQILVVGHLEQGQQDITAYFSSTGFSGHSETIAMTCDLNIEALLDLSQMFIKLAAKVGEAAVIGGLENNVSRNLDSIQDG
jgi:hypothetical protein